VKIELKLRELVGLVIIWVLISAAGFFGFEFFKSRGMRTQNIQLQSAVQQQQGIIQAFAGELATVQNIEELAVVLNKYGVKKGG